ncbi:MAG: SIS domain-containing protein, partial [Deltaproteobacteria bacterium]|nr:SIS domain-containing protein [Deltaproteobacteria bacterium]
MNADAIIKLAQETIRTEIDGLENIISQIDESLVKTVECIADLKGKVILTGIGKSGIIAKKIAATMVSLGTPAMFIHPVDGLHGDLGAVMPQDAAIVLSNSGNSKEISDLLPSLKKLGIKIIAITGNPGSDLAKKADI